MTAGKDLISVIIPFYNGEAYVSTCVESLKKQTYNHFEAIFIDDGSTDHTAARIAAYTDERFVILHQEKAGVSAARNLGLAHARGDYLAFMDIDDIMEPEMLESQLEAILRSGADMVLCDYKKVYSDGKEELFSLPWQNQLLRREQIAQMLIPWSIWRKEGAIMGALWRTMIRRSLYEAYPVRFYEEVAIAEDLLFLLELYNKADSIYIHSNCLYQYRMHSGSAINRYRANCLPKTVQFYRIFMELLKKEKLFDVNRAYYQKNKCRMYTTVISNSARNPRADEAHRELIQLRDELKKEVFDWRECKLAFLYCLSLWLLEKGCCRILYRLYRIKEQIRLRERTNKEI